MIEWQQQRLCYLAVILAMPEAVAAVTEVVVVVAVKCGCWGECCSVWVLCACACVRVRVHVRV